MPPTWPRIQLFGSGFGQDASNREGRDFAGASRGRKRGHTDQHRGGKAGKKRFEAAGRGKDRVRAIWHWRHGFSPLFSCVVVRVSGE
jgi:hypothetical protein